MTGLHAAGWPLFGVILAALGAGAVIAAARNRAPAALEWSRRGVLVLLVAQASIGLALATRGAAPEEGLHWIYGGAIIGALLIPGALPAEVPASRRSWALATGSLVAAILAWRLWASG